MSPTTDSRLGAYMADQGGAFGVDLNELYVVAHDLTKVADDYSQAEKLVASCNPPQVAAPWTNIVPQWPVLCSSVTDILSDTFKNLTDTATALRHTVDTYAAADQAAADELHSLEQLDQSQPGW